MDVTRGKQAVRASSAVKSFQQKKRVKPLDDARFWCDIVLDKDGFKKKFIDKTIGFGVFTTMEFKQGQFLLEYVGDDISSEEASKRSKVYKHRGRSIIPRCYMYYFTYKGEERCIDATTDSHRMAKFINDAPLKSQGCNAKMKLVAFDGRPRLCLFALRDITYGEEIRYDYGEENHLLFWRNKASKSGNRPGSKCRREETAEPEVSDEDPFDVDRGLGQRRAEELQSSDEDDQLNLCDEVDVSDVQDPDYVETCSESSSTDDSDKYLSDVLSDENEGDTLHVKTDLEVHWRQTNADDDTPVAKVGKHTLLRSSFYYLKNTLSDEVIDAYMHLLVQRRNVLYIDTINSTNIFEGRLRQTDLLKKENLEDYDMCMAVVNENGGHWVLLVIHVQNKEIVYVNPLGETERLRKKYCHNWYNFLDKRSEIGFCDSSTRPWKISTIEHQRQMDSVSCGIFVLKFAELYLEGKPLVISSSIENARKDVGRKLLSESMPLSTSYRNPLSDVIHTIADKTARHGTRSETVTNQRQGRARNGSKTRVVDAACSDSETNTSDTPEMTTQSETRVMDTACNDSETSTSDTPVMTSAQPDEHRCDICNKVFKKKGGLTTHIKSHSSQLGTYKKPKRPCPFCGLQQSQLTRHLKTKHSDRPEVQRVKELPNGTKEQNDGFDSLRKIGIAKYNEKQALTEVPVYIAERKTGTEETLVKCSKCGGNYKRNLFYRHKIICTGESTTFPIKIELDTLKLPSNKDSDDFNETILSRFHRNEVGNLCRSDTILLVIGERLYQRNKRKVGKDGAKTVMNDMRLLARLYIAFKEFVSESNTLEDMFSRENMKDLHQAIDAITRDPEDKLKYGVKHAIHHLLKTSAKYLVGHYRVAMDDKKADELEKFLQCFEHYRDEIFSDAAYAIGYSRQEKLRMPEEQPLESDVQKLRDYTLDVIKTNTCPFKFVGWHEFVALRDALCSRITLYNARRGGEPSRLHISNFRDAESGRWTKRTDLERLPEWEQRLFNELIITYHPGKGSILVPVLFPKDCIPGLKILCSSEIRQRVKVRPDNPYLFPTTRRYTIEHTLGWNATSKMMNEAQLKRPDLMNATKQRHRISTMYCALEIPEVDRKYFYKHMGHKEEVNWGTYQNPLAMQQITKVGRHLADIDRGESLCGTDSSRPVTQNTQDCDGTHHAVPGMSLSGKDSSGPDTQINNEQDSEWTEHKDACMLDNAPKEHQDCDTHVPSKEKKGRDYFRWTKEETRAIKDSFKEWIEMPTGNSLPSKAEVDAYVEEKQCRFTSAKLRTKIMNEQNKRQDLARKRMRKMME